MKLFEKLEIWFGKTCILAPLQKGCWGPIRKSVALTDVTLCRSVFPGFEKKRFFRAYFKKSGRMKTLSKFKKLLLAPVLWSKILKIK